MRNYPKTHIQRSAEYDYGNPFSRNNQLTSKGFNFAIENRCSVSCIRTACSSSCGVVGGKHFQKCLSNSSSDIYRFRISFSISGGTSSLLEKKNKFKLTELLIEFLQLRWLLSNVFPFDLSELVRILAYILRSPRGNGNLLYLAFDQP